MSTELSTRMYIGCCISKPTSGTYTGVDNSGVYPIDEKDIYACALGGVWLSFLWERCWPPHEYDLTVSVYRLIEEFPQLDEEWEVYPQECQFGLGERPTLLNIINELHDKCDWTREEIADWLSERGL